MITETNEYSVAAELADLDRQIDLRMKAEAEVARLTERVKVLEEALYEIVYKKPTSTLGDIVKLIDFARSAIGNDEPE